MPNVFLSDETVAAVELGVADCPNPECTQYPCVATRLVARDLAAGLPDPQPCTCGHYKAAHRDGRANCFGQVGTEPSALACPCQLFRSAPSTPSTATGPQRYIAEHIALATDDERGFHL